MKGFALGVALEQRQKATRKSQEHVFASDSTRRPRLKNDSYMKEQIPPVCALFSPTRIAVLLKIYVPKCFYLYSLTFLNNGLLHSP